MADQPLIAAVHVRVDARAAAGGLDAAPPGTADAGKRAYGLLRGNHGPSGVAGSKRRPGIGRPFL
jgi:hypothetical protein